jgi:hypothetical protein
VLTPLSEIRPKDELGHIDEQEETGTEGDSHTRSVSADAGASPSVAAAIAAARVRTISEEEDRISGSPVGPVRDTDEELGASSFGAARSRTGSPSSSPQSSVYMAPKSSPLIGSRKRRATPQLSPKAPPPNFAAPPITRQISDIASEPLDNFDKPTSDETPSPKSPENRSRITNVTISKHTERRPLSAAKLKRAELESQFGQPSTEVSSAAALKNHIIVFGNDANLHMFVSELRRPTVRGENYHPILIVSSQVPPRWPSIKERFNDVYFLLGSITKTATFVSINIENAYSVTLLSTRDSMTKVTALLSLFSRFLKEFDRSKKKILIRHLCLRT